MAEIFVLPGIGRPDLFKMPDADTVLTEAINAGVTEVVVIGRDRCGEIYLASSINDAEKCLGKIMRAMSIITNDTIVNEPYESDGGSLD